jgi:hypothetical protein
MTESIPILRTIDFEVWKQLPVSFSEWWGLPKVRRMQMTLPWTVEHSAIVSGYLFNLGGRDPLVNGSRWSLIADCPWHLESGGQVLDWDDEEVGMSVIPSKLISLNVVDIQAQSVIGDELTFTFSDGAILKVSPFSDRYPNSDPFWVDIWGSSIVYNRDSV